MSNPRKASISVSYNGKNIKTKLGEYLQSFTYNDEASGEGDDISITVNDRNRKWISKWFPNKSDTLSATIILQNWQKEGTAKRLKCGTFIIDSFDFSGTPVQMKMNAIATPANTGFKGRSRTKTYENTTLKNIAKAIAQRYNMSLHYECSTVKIAKAEQSDKTDCSFLNEIVTKYGYAMKIYKNKIVIFNEASYENKAAVTTLKEKDIEPNWSWSTVLGGTYTGAKYEYTDNDANKTYIVTVGGGMRILKVSEASSSLDEAKKITLAKINSANKSDTTMSVELSIPNPSIIATSCVRISGFGKLDGKYYVESSSWEISSGTKQKLSLRKVNSRFKKCTALATNVDKEASA
jgi:hypothetical protein